MTTLAETASHVVLKCAANGSMFMGSRSHEGPDAIITFLSDMAIANGYDFEIFDTQGGGKGIQVRDPAVAPSWDRSLVFCWSPP